MTQPSMIPFRNFIALVFLVSTFGAAQAQWAQVNNGIATLTGGAYTLGASDTHVFAKTLSAIYRSSDNGDNWTEVQQPAAGNTTECGAFFNGRYFAGLNASADCIFWTNDNGDTWNTVTGAPTATVVRGFLEYGGALYAYTSNAGLYRTLDGDSWVTVNNGLTNLNVIGMAAAGPYLLAATVGGGVYRTITAASWTQSTGIGGGDLNGESIWRMGNSMYYGAQGGAEYSSNDFGDTWTSWTQPAFFGLGMVEVKRFGSNLYMETRHFAGGLRDSLYMSTNEGVAWVNITGNLFAPDINGSGILEHDGFVFIGYNVSSPGEGIYRYALSTAMEDLSGSESVAVYPNPTNGEVTLVLPADLTSARYAVSNMVGAVVASGTVSSCTHVLDLSAMPAGCYTVRWDAVPLAPVRVVKH